MPRAPRILEVPNTPQAVADALALNNAAGSDIPAGAWWGWGWGWDGYSYVPVPAYTVPVPAYTVPAPGYAVPAPVDADAIAYCARRYRTYDPDTGTYIGRYGVVRSCP